MDEVVWEFCTDQFRVSLEVCPEDSDPADNFSDDADIAAVRNGDVAWFCASLVVSFKGCELARDVLGGCAYNTVREFYTSHRDPDPMNRNCTIMRAAHGGNVRIGHYFPDMVRVAIREARHKLRRRRAVYEALHLRA